MNSDGALPDCIPFSGHGNTDSDPGWGFAAWSITDWFSDYCESSRTATTAIHTTATTAIRTSLSPNAIPRYPSQMLTMYLMLRGILT